MNTNTSAAAAPGPLAAPNPVIDGTTLAATRTRLAAERTMMAWIRTGLSLISFGFTIYKFFELQESSGPLTEGFVGPRSFALIMIATGLLSVLIAGIHNARETRHLREAGFHVPRSLAALVGALVFFLGIVGLVAVVFRQ